MNSDESHTMPPGYPGIPGRWTSSAKSGIGTALGGNSRVWFTLSHGIVDEVYYPSIDQANTRDLGLLIADGADFFSEEKRHTSQTVEYVADGVPAYRLTNTCIHNRYRIVKTVIVDPERDIVLQRIRFEALQGKLSDYKVFVLLAPHIDNQGAGNDGFVGDYKGFPMLFAQRNNLTLALACSTPFIAMSCGYVGFSDGWQDVSAHKRMTWFYPEARQGNIALTGEIDLAGCGGEFVLALGFGDAPSKAGHHVRASLLPQFDEIEKRYIARWQRFQAKCLDLRSTACGPHDLYRVSTAIMRTCEAKTYPGGVVASLSIPWGTSKGDEDMGGYHLVWTRDQVEVAGAFLAAGDAASTLRILVYLISTQEPDGHWPQNMWLDGTPFWKGIQLDEAAFPILLANTLCREDALMGVDVWPMVQRAATFIVRNGPVTPEDRWEEDGGYSPFTLAVEVAALLAAADFAERANQPAMAEYLRDTADIWNGSIERWTYATGTPLAKRMKVDGYYVRIASADIDHESSGFGVVPIKNRPPDEASADCCGIVSPDALALVRFGLRAADDPAILNTVKVIDALLKTETRTGPVWHRYNGDGYGEHTGGDPFDGTGVGRGWPLLVGERAHYELALGNRAEAERLLHVMEAQSSPGGLLPEQVWDAADIPEKELFNGGPTGSAMPLLWAHAEYVKLMRSLRDGAIFDLPPQTADRYVRRGVQLKTAAWRFNLKFHDLPSGYRLRVELLSPSLVHWSTDRWITLHDTPTFETPFGIHVADLPTESLPPGDTIVFTFCEVTHQCWEGLDYTVTVV